VAHAEEPGKSDAAPETAPEAGAAARAIPGWPDVIAMSQEMDLPAWLPPLLRRFEGTLEGDRLLLTTESELSAERLADGEAKRLLNDLFVKMCGRTPEIRVQTVAPKRKTRDELRAEILGHPLVQQAEHRLGAAIIDFGSL
jgi:hypothetical protein